MPAHSDSSILGVLRPVGGGDPIPLKKHELFIGRRPTNDIHLDFENVSGKHCSLRLINGVWMVRDLGSTNGTTVNGLTITSEHTVMPDDEFGVATHLFHIDYEPSGPEAVISKSEVFDDDVLEERKKHSLMELAGIDVEDRPAPRTRAKTAPAKIERLSADEAEFEDVLPDYIKKAPTPVVAPTDDDFLKLIEDEVKPPPKQ